jgi:hypothetical protein
MTERSLFQECTGDYKFKDQYNSHFQKGDSRHYLDTCRKATNKICQPLMIKTFSKAEMGMNFLNVMKNINMKLNCQWGKNSPSLD